MGGKPKKNMIHKRKLDGVKEEEGESQKRKRNNGNPNWEPTRGIKLWTTRRFKSRTTMGT